MNWLINSPIAQQPKVLLFLFPQARLLIPSCETRISTQVFLFPPSNFLRGHEARCAGSMSEVVTGALAYLTNQTTLHVDFGERPRPRLVVLYCPAIPVGPLFTHEKECCDEHCHR